MRLPRFRLRALMIAVAVVAVMLEALWGLSESHRWYRQVAWAREYRRMAAEVEARKGTPRERPTDPLLVLECRSAAANHWQWAKEARPPIVGVACLGAVTASPLLLVVRGVRWLKARRAVRND